MKISISNPAWIAFASAFTFCGVAHAQVIVNGDFETGGLASWTTGGSGAGAVIRASNIATLPAGTIVPQPPGEPATNYFAILSTGPGNRGGAAQLYDGNTTSDYDLATLSQTFTLPSAPGVVSFDWNYPTSEQDQADNFDDLFDLQANGTRIWSGSACKANGSSYSNFPNAPCSGLTQRDWTVSGPAAVTGTVLRFGIGAWQHVCVALPATLTAGSAVTLRYAVLDQNDNGFDSALLLDNIRVGSACDATLTDALRQLTNTSGQSVTLKNGTITLRPVTNTKPSVDDTGTNVAFISNANLAADNPNLLAQVYTWNGATFARATSLIVDATGKIDSVALSGAANAGFNGRYIAIAAQLTGSASTQIYRYDRSTGTLSTVTATTSCVGNGALDNVNPSISTDGSRIAWESVCAALTGAADGVKRVVYATIAGTTWTVKAPIIQTGTCAANNPRLNRSGNGQFLAFDSDCNPTGSNGAANHLVFRNDTTLTGTAAFKQAPGSATIDAASPSLDSSGRYIFYLRFDNAANYHSEIWRYDTNNAGTNVQLTTTATNNIFLDVYSAGTTTTARLAYERLDIGTNLSEVGYTTISGTTATLTPVGQGFPNVFGGPPQLITGARIGLDGAVPVVTFYSDFDFLDTNADNNPEIFQARGQ